MKITFRLFAVIRERAGVSVVNADLPADATVFTARDALLTTYPALNELIPRVAFAVNRNYATLSTKLNEGDEVAILPPVSGG